MATKSQPVEQVIVKLKDVDNLRGYDTNLLMAAKRGGIVDQPHCRRRPHPSLGPNEWAKRPVFLERENDRLKKIVAAQTFDISTLN